MTTRRNSYWGRIPEGAADPRELERRPDVIALSRGEMYLAACSAILRDGHGFVSATDADVPRDAEGNWIPLFTYPCIEYIRQFDFSGKRVFEWGSGASTLFWQDRGARVTSVENDRRWYERMLELKGPGTELLFDDGDGFPRVIQQVPGEFDIIVIDSAGYRYDCALATAGRLATGGMVILDNAEWHPRTAGALRDHGLIQVDFSGFKVTEFHTSTTSVFLHRDFAFPTREPMQPAYAVGAKRLLSEWDQPGGRR